MQIILKNSIRCRVCGDVIESVSEQDLVTCSCGRVSVGGGHYYLQRICREGPKDIEERSVVVTDEEPEEDRDEVEYY